MVKWFRCVDDHGFTYFCRGESATDCRFKLSERGYIRYARLGMKVYAHCDRTRLPDVIPMVFKYCYVSNDLLICSDEASGLEVAIPLSEARKALLG